MGECGCGQGIERGRIKFGDLWLLVGIYPGCEECARVICVDLKVTPDKDMIHDGWYEHLPDWTDKVKSEDGMAMPILTLPNLMVAFKENAGSPEDYSDADDFISDNFLAIRESVFKTIKEYEKTGKVED